LTSPALVLSDLVKTWKGADAPVLDRLSLSVDAGTVAGVSGSNGAGKTTLLRIAAALIAPDSGTVAIGDLRPERRRREFHRRVGFVSAGNGALYARLTVDDHLMLWSKLALLPRADAQLARDRTRTGFALDELRGRRVDRLSTGQRQRLRLALGFLHEPDVLLLDEPAASLDEEAQALLATEIARARERGAAVIVCSPVRDQGKLGVDRLFLLAGGRIAQA
jgi:ABC-2 type transport system ATP-binding protein